MQSHTIDLTQILLSLITLAGLILAPILTQLAFKFLKLSQDSESRKVASGIIDNGISLVEAQAGAYVTQHGKLQVTNENVAKVAEYVLPKAQESLDRLNVKGTGRGMTGDQLGQIIAAKIASRQAPPTVVSAPAPATVTVKPEGA